MCSEAKKFKREPFFSVVEKTTLVDLVVANWEVVESKKTDSHSVSVKLECWKMIEDAFNSQAPGSHYRELIKLKTLWENIKKRAKAAVVYKKINLLKTGGQGKRTVADPVLARVMGLFRIQGDPLALKNDKEDANDDVQIASGSAAPRSKPGLADDGVVEERSHIASPRCNSAEKPRIALLKTLLSEKHAVKMKILSVRLEQEKEKLKQERIRTAILEHKLWVCNNQKTEYDAVEFSLEEDNSA